MKTRYVLEGAPGSGKSTLLFGSSDGDPEFPSMHTMVGLGHNCLHESVAEAHASLSRKGIDFSLNKELWLREIVEIEKVKFHRAKDGLNFYDRCFHHWKIFSSASGIPLPDWYDEFNGQVRYDDPIFIVAPVESMDLSAPIIHESRRFTWQQRLEMHTATMKAYNQFGYSTVEVPMFVEGDIEDNNRKRIKYILECIDR